MRGRCIAEGCDALGPKQQAHTHGLKAARCALVHLYGRQPSLLLFSNCPPCSSVLHQELAADKARMAEFVASLQPQHAQQAPQPGQAAGGGPPAVRVN